MELKKQRENGRVKKGDFFIRYWCIRFSPYIEVNCAEL